MSNVSIYEKNWLKLVFEGKNQAYGAYVLRQQHPRTSLLALFLGVIFMASSILIGSMLMSFSSEDDIPVPIVPSGPSITVSTVHLEEEPEVESSKPRTQKPINEPKVNLFSNLVVAKETKDIEDVTRTEKPVPVIDAPDGKDNGTTSTIGAGSSSSSGGGQISGENLVPTPEKPKGPLTTTELDKLPQFPGGIDKFYIYIRNNFNKPELDDEETVTVLVAFIIEENGSMSNIKVTRNPGYGLGDEAIRVLKSLKIKWLPGIKDGKAVRTFYTLPIKVKT